MNPKKKIPQCILISILCILILSLPVFGYTANPKDTIVIDSKAVPIQEILEEEPALTPPGNSTLVDDIQEEVIQTKTLGNKEFLTVKTRSGAVFYLVIDRSGNEENVYFLNMVDDRDLLSLLGEEFEKEKAPVCICGERCEAGKVNTDCPLCRNDLTECEGKEDLTKYLNLEAEKEENPKLGPETENENLKGILLLIGVLLLLAFLGFYAYKELIRPKVRGRTDPKTLPMEDYGDDETYEEEI